jgi:nucleotide-binding universal stress UspA family protein
MLAAVDLSRRAHESVQHALALADALSAGLELLYVADSGSFKDDGANVWPPVDWSQLSANFNLCWRIVRGKTVQTIATHAEAINADMVVLTTRNLGTLSSMWRGSKTRELLRTTPRPVCIASADELDGDYRFRNRRIVCVVGLDGKEKGLIDYAQDIAERSSSELVLLHVVPEPNEGLLQFAVDAGSRPLSRERAASQLRELLGELRLPAFTSVMVGEPSKCIPLASREHSADLVMMSRAYGKSHGVYSGELERVLRRLRCPLLTIPVDGEAPIRRVSSGTDGLSVPAATNAYLPYPDRYVHHEPISAATRPSTSSPPDSRV